MVTSFSDPSPCHSLDVLSALAVGVSMRVNRLLEKVTVTIYSRPGCHLCEEAKSVILVSGCENLTIEEINIDDDPVLHERYQYDIPVVFINGIKAFKHSVELREFRRKFRRLGDLHRR